ncbi:hypothetical protein [Methylobacterium oxalidis]|uniref:hypothetical protein n=1 Tax=Methylobacterium oxalidis TaxID=944322 RepID=UPI00331612AA
MSIFVHLAGVSAALAAGLALAMPGAGATARAPQDAAPNAAQAAAPAIAAGTGPAPLCREAAWPYAVAACSDRTAGPNGRSVRVISYTGAAPGPRADLRR